MTDKEPLIVEEITYGSDLKKAAAEYLRTGSLRPALAFDRPGSKLIETMDQPKVTQRTMSLATRPDTDPMELVERAQKLCKNPIKLSFQNVFYEVDVITTEHDREKDPNIGKFKRQAIVKNVSGYAPPG